MVEPRAGRSPEAERPVDVHPGTMTAGDLDRLTEGVEGPCVHLPACRHDDRPSATVEEGGEGIRPKPALVVAVHLDHGLLPEAEVAHREVDRVVAVPPGDPHGRSSMSPRRLTSQPSRASTACRAAERQARLAIICRP